MGRIETLSWLMFAVPRWCTQNISANPTQPPLTEWEDTSTPEAMAAPQEPKGRSTIGKGEKGIEGNYFGAQMEKRRYGSNGSLSNATGENQGKGKMRNLPLWAEGNLPS